MGTVRLVLGDQLSRDLSSLQDVNPGKDIILMAEVSEEATYVRHHKQKIAFLFSAMRHFAAELEREGFTVRYRTIDDPKNKGNLFEEVRSALKADKALTSVCITACGEYRLAQEMASWEERLGCPVTILEDDRFLATPEEFAAWAKGRKQLTMEYFYREMRKKTGLLMDGDKPVGGQWNYDKDNRARMDPDVRVPHHHVCRLYD